MRSGKQSGRDVLTRSVRGQARRVGLGAVLGCVHQLGEALVPVLIGVVIDQAVAGQDAGRLALWLVVLAVMYVALSWSFRLGARAGERGAEEAAHTLRLAIVRRVLDARGGAEEDGCPASWPTSPPRTPSASVR